MDRAATAQRFRYAGPGGTLAMSRAPAPTIWWRAKEVPYLFTLLLAALGWCVIRVIDKVESAPTLAYKHLSEWDDKGQRVEKYRVENISRTALFRRMSFYLDAPEGSVLKGEGSGPMPTAKVVSKDNLPPDNQGKTVEFYVAQFQPGTTWYFWAAPATDPSGQVPSTERPALLRMDFSHGKKEDEPNEPVVEPQAVRLVEDGLETFLVHYQVELLAWAAVFWSLLAVTYLWRVRFDPE